MKDLALEPLLLLFGLIILAVLAPQKSNSLSDTEVLHGKKAQLVWDSMEEFKQVKDLDTLWREDLSWRCRKDRGERKENQTLECQKKNV